MEKVKVLFLCLFGVLALLAVVSGKEEMAARQRIKQEEEFVERFLEKAGELEEETEDTERDKVREEASVKKWEDDTWFVRDGVTYTPEFAKGTLDCVLEMDTIRLRRGVYIGTREEILHNLDVWMLTAARPDYRLGETHYCIYGHNCVGSGQEISFNRLQEIEVGEYFTLTTDTKEYRYRVEAVYGMGREEATRDLVDNFSLPSDRCYIITCGRGEYRYLDFVVEGRLVNG